MDVVSRTVRRRMMQAISQRDTPVERLVRRALFREGCRFRANVRGLPGTPDIVNKSRKWAIFVHGCFWHGHAFCNKTKGGRKGRVPKTNASWWQKKLMANKKRDRSKARQLRSLGYAVLVVWECEALNPPRLRNIVATFVRSVYGPTRRSLK